MVPCLLEHGHLPDMCVVKTPLLKAFHQDEVETTEEWIHLKALPSPQTNQATCLSQDDTSGRAVRRQDRETQRQTAAHTGPQRATPPPPPQDLGRRVGGNVGDQPTPIFGREGGRKCWGGWQPLAAQALAWVPPLALEQLALALEPPEPLALALDPPDLLALEYTYTHTINIGQYPHSATLPHLP
ncbi:UNVERIFIED_CONTAM: hypothetical protein FKN15_037454 [Acipenser sinensis]